MNSDNLINIYVSFGQNHIHHVNGKTFDVDSLARIKCLNHEHGREIAFDAFDSVFCATYNESDIEKYKSEGNFNMFWPRGIIDLD